MPSEQAFKTGEYCEQCGKDTFASNLFILFSIKTPTELIPNPTWDRLGRYCPDCLKKQITQEFEINHALKINTEVYAPFKPEGNNLQTRR